MVTTATDLEVSINTSDPRVKEIILGTNTFSGLAPGEIDTSTVFTYYAFKYSEGYHPDSTIGNPIQLNVNIYSDNYLYWVDSTDFTVTALENDPIKIFPNLYTPSKYQMQ